MTMELYPLPINMIETDPQTGARTRMTTITPDDIRSVGCANIVTYPNIFPQDKMQLAQVAAMLLDKKIISLDTARGSEYLSLKNPTLENRKVLGDLAYYNPAVVEASIPLALLMTDPIQYLLYMQVKQEQQQKELMMMQMAMKTGQVPSEGGGKPPTPPPGGGGETVEPADLKTVAPPSAGAPSRPARSGQVGNAPF